MKLQNINEVGSLILNLDLFCQIENLAKISDL